MDARRHRRSWERFVVFVFAYFIRRVLYAVPILLGTTLILFVIFFVVPGDPAIQLAGKHATPETLANIRAELGLDKPFFQQYLGLLKQIVTFDFGRSYITKQRISEMLMQGIGPSLSVTLPPFMISIMTSILVGLLLAYYRGSIIDRGIVAICVGVQSVSILVYIIAGQYFLAYLKGYFPISGFDPSWTGRWYYLFLPWMIYLCLSLAPEIRFYRTVMLDEIYQDYVRTARSKGLGELVVMLKHVLKNAMIPIITSIVISLPALILGSLLIENFFSIPGLGTLTINAVVNQDRPVLIAVTILGTIGYISFNILSDLLYALVDPRVQVK